MGPGRVLMLGLDGVGLDLARSLASRGVMPHLARLLEKGRVWGLDSPLPEVSPVCWTSLFSGQGPGRHGVFGFAHPQPGAYRVEPVDSSAVRVPRLWEELSQTGRPSVVLNVPLTYPARPLEGIMVSGFVAPELTQAVHPPSLLPLLQQMGYEPETDLDQGIEDPAALLAGLRATLATRLELFQRLLDSPWDLWVGVITDSDRVNHFLWPALHEPGHALAAEALGLYTMMDDFVGLLWDRFGPQVEEGRLAFLVAADHAFGPIRSEVYLNPWLQEQGWLAVEGLPGSERILPASQALALDPGRIYLHRCPLFPGGADYSPQQAQALASTMAARLRELTYTQVEMTPQGPRLETVPVIAQVHLGAELYEGPQAHWAPDLVAQAAPGFSLRAGLGRGAVFGHNHLTGTHAPKNALALWLGPPPPQEAPRDISQLHAMMSWALNLPHEPSLALA